ncbi:MAG: helix-turn-helix transcriptional regulator [Hyphomicrobiales bacterium]|nr:helix-turn-helix transcriptional regulator [Hyphomicrobiales bacterium]MCP5370161.1 helix-turn-helix transcriptional regulator [Hyphomicrobiales bacterium]
MTSPTPTKKRGRPPKTSHKVERLPPGVPNPVDVHVGGRVRLRRTLLGMSQEKLGEAVGLTFQQIQKYERGANRIGASRLYELSSILDVPVSFFFDDLPDELKTHEGRFTRGLEDQGQAPMDNDPLARRETLELVRAYYRITDPAVRKRMFELTKSLARMEDEVFS